MFTKYADCNCLQYLVNIHRNCNYQLCLVNIKTVIIILCLYFNIKFKLTCLIKCTDKTKMNKLTHCTMCTIKIIRHWYIYIYIYYIYIYMLFFFCFFFFSQGSQVYVKAIEKVGIVTAEERNQIHQGLETVGLTFMSVEYVYWNFTVTKIIYLL